MGPHEPFQIRPDTLFFGCWCGHRRRMGVVDGRRSYLVPAQQAHCPAGVKELAFLCQTGESQLLLFINGSPSMRIRNANM